MRLVRGLVTVAAGVMTAVLAFASPAAADGATLTITGLPGSIDPGRPVVVSVKAQSAATNDSGQLQREFVLRLPGLTGSQVTFETDYGGGWRTMPERSGTGVVRGIISWDTPVSSLFAGSYLTFPLRLTFAAGAPYGRATLVLEGYLHTSGSDQLKPFGKSSTYATTVGHAPPATSSPPTPSASATQSPSTSEVTPPPTGTTPPTTGPGPLAAAPGGLNTTTVLAWVASIGSVGLAAAGTAFMVVRRRRRDELSSTVDRS